MRILTIHLLLVLASLGCGVTARGQTTAFNRIASPAALKERMRTELRATRPDFVVFVPSVSDMSATDTGNEHFLVFNGPDDSLTVVWTQSSAESQPDQHIAFSRSMDEGRTWARPCILAGPRRAGAGLMASWAYPLVSRAGCIYVLYSQHMGIHDTFVHHTGWLHCPRNPPPPGRPEIERSPIHAALSVIEDLNRVWILSWYPYISRRTIP